jgi:arsenate reductase-like glutaredoxin family protein
VNAAKERFGEDALADLFDGARKIVVMKGKKVVTFDPAKDEAADIAAVALGPTGNLRAPAVKTGKTWVIGFNEDAWTDIFG